MERRGTIEDKKGVRDLKLTVNGIERIFDDRITLDEMLKKLNLDTRGIIIDRNMEVVCRSEYDSLMLKEGDRIELIRLVGGG